MIRALFFTSLFLFFAGFNAHGQKRYEEKIRKDGLSISSKWGKAKDADGNRKAALLFRIENTNDHFATYAFKVQFYYEGILRETGIIETTCLRPKQRRVGLLNGTYLITEQISEKQMQSPDFGFDLDEIEVEKVEGCTEEG